jgi:hypothetical protein
MLLKYKEKEPVAQPVEHLTFNQRVDGSNPSGLTNKIKVLGVFGLLTVQSRGLLHHTQARGLE